MAEFVRPVRAEDIAQIAQIETLCFAMPWSEESIRKDIEENVVSCWLVMDNGEGKVLAYAAMWFVLDEAHVCNVAVHPDHSGKGYGRAIFGALVETAKKNSMSLMELEVRRSNTVAQNLYHYFGFIDVGYRKRYYEDNKEYALLMFKEFRGEE